MNVGEKVRLVSIEKEDLELLRTWRNNEDFKKNFREYREITRDMQEKWFNSLATDKNTLMFAIRDKVTDELLGCCGLCYINWVYRNADLSLYIGKDGAYIDDKGYAEEACKLLFDYAFKQLGLVKVWTELYCFDERKYRFYTEKFNFRKDGVFRKQYFYDGKWHDSNLLSLLDEEYFANKI